MKQAARERKARNRKQKLSASGHVYGDLARLADVSYSMAYKWMNGERESVKIERAFAVLTGRQTVAS
jgi:hypothetical protein